MKPEIRIHNPAEIARFFTDASGRQQFKVDLNKCQDLIKYISFLYMSGESANIIVDGVDKQTFEIIKDTLHSAALAKIKKLEEQNQ